MLKVQRWQIRNLPKCTYLCLSVQKGAVGRLVKSNASWDRSHGSVPPPRGRWITPLDIRPGTPLTLMSGGQPGHHTLDPERHMVVATEAHMVCNRALRILLECFLVFWQFFGFGTFLAELFCYSTGNILGVEVSCR